MVYALLRALLFRLDAETSHNLSLSAMSALHRLHLLGLLAAKVPDAPVTVMGIRFANPLGLAAGLDKNGDHVDALGRLGFGFVELGTVTPRPQPGNPKPRLFRLVQKEAIINRMGFNNKGVAHLVQQVRKARYKGPIGINIGKNFDTPVERANDDYLSALREVYALASYVTVNVSSPNTPGLRSLQFGESLDSLLAAIKAEQGLLAKQHGRYVPIAIKIAPDMNDDEIRLVAASLLKHGLDAVIATNTTLDRDAVAGELHANEAGGLSGRPLTQKSTHVIKVLYSELGESLPIIGVGGISSAQDALDKLNAGAKLVQIYSGFIYQGPGLIGEVVEAVCGAQKKQQKK